MQVGILNEYTKAGLQNLIPSVTDSCKMPQSKGFFELLYLLLCICDVLEPTKRNINLNQLQLSTKDKNQIIIRFESNADNTVIANYNNYPELFTPSPDNRLNTRKTLIKMKNRLSPKR